MKKKSILLAATAVMLVAAMSIGGMLAYFTDDDQAVNTFTAGKVEINLAEDATGWTDEETGKEVHGSTSGDAETGFSYHIFPGESYAKKPVITVLKDSEDAYLVATVTISNKAGLYEIFDGTDVDQGTWLSLAGTGKLVSGGISDYTAESTTWQGLPGTMLKDSEGENYAFISYSETETEIVYTYWFIDPVAKSATDTVMPALFEQVNVPADFDNDDMAKLNNSTITINAYAVQAVGFDNAKDAYEAAFVE
nr:SipW-dependent-type signal peptide-containing protein [Intestinimonas timonensis]